MSVVFPDGTWIPIAIEAFPEGAAPSSVLHPHAVTFGRQKGEQFTVRLTPGTLQEPPVPVDPPIITDTTTP